MADACIFCKIVSGEVPSSKVYEDDAYLAFLDISPISPGHTLVIPKKHYAQFLDTPVESTQKLMAVIKKIVPAIVKGVQAESYNLGMNNGKEAGQVVMHAHWHIIPRFADDGLKHWPGGKYEANDQKYITEEIVKWLKEQDEQDTVKLKGYN